MKNALLVFCIMIGSICNVHSQVPKPNVEKYINQVNRMRQNWESELKRSSQMASKTSAQYIYALYINGNPAGYFADKESCRAAGNKFKSNMNNLMLSIINDAPAKIQSGLRSEMQNYINNVSIVSRSVPNPNYKAPTKNFNQHNGFQPIDIRVQIQNSTISNHNESISKDGVTDTEPYNPRKLNLANQLSKSKNEEKEVTPKVDLGWLEYGATVVRNEAPNLPRLSESKATTEEEYMYGGASRNIFLKDEPIRNVYYDENKHKQMADEYYQKIEKGRRAADSIYYKNTLYKNIDKYSAKIDVATGEIRKKVKEKIRDGAGKLLEIATGGRAGKDEVENYESNVKTGLGILSTPPKVVKAMGNQNIEPILNNSIIKPLSDQNKTNGKYLKKKAGM